MKFLLDMLEKIALFLVLQEEFTTSRDIRSKVKVVEEKRRTIYARLDSFVERGLAVKRNKKQEDINIKQRGDKGDQELSPEALNLKLPS